MYVRLYKAYVKHHDLHAVHVYVVAGRISLVLDPGKRTKSYYWLQLKKIIVMSNGSPNVRCIVQYMICRKLWTFELADFLSLAYTAYTPPWVSIRKCGPKNYTNYY